MSTAMRTRWAGRIPVRRLWARLLPAVGALLALAVAAVLLLVDAPVVLRSLVVLPVVILVTGSAATRLLLGAGPGAGDRLVRLLLSVVLGVLMLLASVLVAQAAGIPLTAVSAPAGALGLALVLVLLALLRGGRPGIGDWRRSGRRWVRPVVALTAAGGVLAGALGLAVAVQPTPVERYTLLAFADPSRYGADPLNATPGGRIALEVSLTSYGQPLSATAPATTVTVAERPAGGSRTRWTAATDVSSTADGDTDGRAVDQRIAQVTFRAPRRPGVYPIRLQVDQTDADPLLLTAWVQVSG